MNLRNIPITRVYRCYYCPEHPGHVTADGEYAIKLEDGGWKCGECVTTDLRRNMVKVLGPNHEKTREFIRKEDREVKDWNEYVDRWTQFRAIDLEKGKNKYL